MGAKRERRMTAKAIQKVAGKARRVGCPRGTGASSWRFCTVKPKARRRFCKAIAKKPEKPAPGSENEKCYGHVPLYDYLAVFLEDPVWRACQ